MLFSLVLFSLLVAAAVGFIAWRQDRYQAENYYELARLYSLTGSPADAAFFFKQAWEIEPRIDTAFSIGESLMKIGDTAQAEEWANLVLRSAPKDPGVRGLMADIHWRKGEIERAEQELLALISEYAKDSQFYDMLGTLYLETERLADAARIFEMGTKMDPTDANLHNGLGVAYFASGEEEKAKEEYERALEIDPDHKNARANLELLLQD